MLDEVVGLGNTVVASTTIVVWSGMGVLNWDTPLTVIFLYFY